MRALFNRLYALYHPEQFHGWGRESNYFEGWYYKVVNASEDRAFAFIPGIAMGGEGNSHAFIQVMDGKKNHSSYLKFAPEKFLPDSQRFSLLIEENHFTMDNLSLNTESCHGQLIFKNQVPWPVKWNSPGIMGPYAFVPLMECYHGILSMDHSIEGVMNINGEKIDFSGGRGYIEKDWGTSFPSAYIWMQANHFSETGTSIKLSVANIPWLRSSFVGFIAGFWWQGELIQFTTYNSSKLIQSYADEEVVKIELHNKQYILRVEAERSESTALASPILGFMDGRINETMNARLHVILTERKSGKEVFSDYGRNAGLEVAGKLEQILT